MPQRISVSQYIPRELLLSESLYTKYCRDFLYLAILASTPEAPAPDSFTIYLYIFLCYKPCGIFHHNRIADYFCCFFY